MKSVLLSLLLIILTSTFIHLNAQTTLSRVHSILQTNCGGSSGCHGGANPIAFKVDSSENYFYDQVVNVNPLNPTALSKGHKLIDPGYPFRSFLLRKIAHGLSPDLALLQPNEGGNMPNYQPKLADADIEMVRQWIMFGAPKTGIVVDEQLVIDYYNGKGLGNIAVPAPPAAGEGFQIHCGPVFLAPNAEKEYKWKFDTKLDSSSEAYRFDGQMSVQSHHLILYKYNDGFGASEPEGLRQINTLLDQSDLFLNASQIAVWQFPREHILPAGTSYFWEANPTLNLNFHVKNYSNDSILAAHSYVNIYTKAAGSGDVQMFSDLVVYGGFSPNLLNIPNTGSDIKLTIDQSGINETYNIWILQAHTHKLGKDYEIFLRNSDGSKDSLIYSGKYNADYTVETGFYDYAHPPVREFSPLLPVDMNKGLIHEATYLNNGPAPVGFGLTTNDEMFITYMHYTESLPATGIKNNYNNALTMNVYPNPLSGDFAVNYSLTSSEQVNISLVSVLGEEHSLVQNEQIEKGNHIQHFNAEKLNLTSGVYFLRVKAGSKSSVRKIIVK